MTDAPTHPPFRAFSGRSCSSVIAFAAWSGYWFYVAHQIEGRIKSHQDALVQQGYQVSFDPYHVGGYPFRMFVQLNNVTVIAPSGRGLASPRLEAEANAYALDKWVLVAPQGLTLYRGPSRRRRPRQG
ncbi:MAG: DUF2125 domain-containing protein [Asticcacaulis sp.]